MLPRVLLQRSNRLGSSLDPFVGELPRVRGRHQHLDSFSVGSFRWLKMKDDSSHSFG